MNTPLSFFFIVMFIISRKQIYQPDYSLSISPTHDFPIFILWSLKLYYFPQSSVFCSFSFPSGRFSLLLFLCQTCPGFLHGLSVFGEELVHKRRNYSRTLLLLSGIFGRTKSNTKRLRLIFAIGSPLGHNGDGLSGSIILQRILQLFHI